TGDIAPGDAIQAALLANPASVAARTGMGVERAAMGPLEAAQRETGVMAIPRAANAGPVGTALSAEAAAPAAQLASEQLQKSAVKAGETPTGSAVPADEAGAAVRSALVAGGDKVPPRLQVLTNRTRADE